MTSPFIQGKTREKKTPPSPKGTKATVSVVPPSFPRRDAQALYGRYRGRPSAPTARIRWPGFGTAAQERTSSNSFRGTLTAGDVPLWRGRGLAYFLLHGVDNILYSIPPISQIIKRDFFRRDTRQRIGRCLHVWLGELAGKSKYTPKNDWNC